MRFKCLALLAPLALAASALPQVVDTGSETGIAAKAAPAGAASEKPPDQPPASSPEEERSRELLQLKANRAAITGKSAGDPQLAEIDEKISALQQQLAESARGLFVDGAPETAGQTAAAVYPRIVQPAYDYAASTSADKSFTAPAGTMSASTADSAASVAARKALEQNVTVVADQKSIASVFEILAVQTHANILINWTALQTAGIDKNTPVTFTLTDVSCRRALRALLEQAGGTTASLSYTIDDGVVTISTREDLYSSKYQTVRVYNVRDFLTVDPQYPLQIAAAISQEHVNNLIDTLKSIVAPDTWRDNGGSVGSIRELDGLLIVNQINDNQIAVEQLLAELRAAR